MKLSLFKINKKIIQIKKEQDELYNLTFFEIIPILREDMIYGNSLVELEELKGGLKNGIFK